jgi:hypothetical protein
VSVTGVVTGNSTVNTAVTGNSVATGNSSANVIISPGSIFIGNSSVNATINSTSFSGTANVASYIIANSGIVSNSSGVFVNTSYISAVSGTPDNANNAYYLGGTAAASYQLNSTLAANVAILTANNSNNLGGTPASSYQLNSTLAANVATLTANNANNLGGTAAASYQLNSTLAANVATLTANNANNLNGKTEVNLNVNSALTSNNSSYLGGTAAASYQLNSTLAANVAILTANNSNNLNGKTEANLNVNNSLTANNSTYLNGQLSSYYTNATNISSGTLDTARLPATVNVSTAINVGSNVNVNTSTINVGSVQLKSNSIVVPANASIDFDTTTYKPAFQKGRMYWDNEEQTIIVFGDGSSFEQSMGQREWVRTRNSTSNTIPKGTPVYITGVHISGDPVHGHHPTIAPGDASDYDKSQIIGITGEDIAPSAHGYTVVRGYIEGLDTSALTSGQRAHLGFATPGTIVQNAPEYPNYPTDLGMCLSSNSTVGTFYVDLAMHTAERFRTTQDMYVGGDLSVSGNLNITGSVTTTNATNLSVGDNILYIGTGDTISQGATTFTGSGLNDMLFHGVFEGTSSIHYYVKIDSTGTTDTFAWSKDNFSTTVASGVAITGNYQTLDNGIKVQFNATTGHTLNNKWDGTAAPVNVDLGWVGNYNDGTYHHTGLFRDATDGVYKFFQGYIPEPDAAVNIDTSHASFQLASVQANTFYGNLIGTANNANNLGGIAAASYMTNTSNYTISGVHIHSANVRLNASLIDSTGAQGTAGQVLTSNGAGNVYWSTVTSSGGAGVNVDSQYTWTNTQTFSNTITFSSVIIGTANNANNLGGTAASSYQLNSTLAANVAILTANNANNLGGTAASSYQLNSTLAANVAILTANNANNLGGTPAASYQLNSTLAANVAVLTANNANNLGGTPAASYQLNSTLAANVATLTANNANNLNTKTEANLNVNNALTANNSSYLGGTAAASYQLNSTLSANVATLTSNNSSYLGGTAAASYQLNSTLAANVAILTANNANNLNGKTEANLNVNNAVTANNSSYLNTKTEANLNVNNAVTANNSSYLGGVVSSSYQLNSTLAANVATLTANNANNLNTKTEANLNVNNALTANNSSYLGGTAAASYQLNSTLAANVAILTANNANNLNGKTEANLNVNNALTTNNSTYLNGQLSSYYTNATNITTGTLPYAQLGVNVVNTTGSFTLSGNTTLGGSNTVITSNFSVSNATSISGGDLTVSNATSNTVLSNRYLTISSASFPPTINFVAQGIGASGRSQINFYTTNTNSIPYFGGLSWLIANGTGSFYSSSIMAQGSSQTSQIDIIVNIGTSSNSSFYIAGASGNTLITNSASTTLTTNVNITGAFLNVASAFVVNSVGAYHTGIVNAASHTVGTSFIANTTQITIAGIPLSANGSNGTATYVLTSNGNIGSPYWATVSGWTGGTMANTAYFSNTATSTNNVSGAVTILGGLGVNGNIYTASRVGFANSSNVSVAYTYYNQSTGSLDTVFG